MAQAAGTPRRRHQQLQLLLLLLLLMVCSNLTAGLPAIADNPLRFGDTPSTACPVAKSLLVDVQNWPGPPIKIELTESSREFLHSLAVASTSTEAADVCFYQGSVNGDSAQIAVAKQRRNSFSAQFHYNGGLYEIPEQAADSSRYTALLVPSTKEQRTCGVSGKPVTSPSAPDSSLDSSSSLHRSKRAVLMDVNSAVQPTDRKYIRLILVGDMYFYQRRAFSNLTVGINRLWEIGNYVNALYKQLGVNVILVYTEVWQSDPYNTTINSVTGNANSAEMLQKFMDYKTRNLNSKMHSAAHLVSGLKMAGSDVGLAHVARLCSATLGGGVNSDLDNVSLNSAVTIAHELGHNLGLAHDEDEKNCSCPDPQGCIMAAVGGDVNPLKWSNCSVFRFNDFTVDNGLGYCMSDPPADSDVLTMKATCGNRILEPGEDCDCGVPQWCNNSCCDPTTCKFTPGSTCASGQCCNKTTCSVMSQGAVCRPRQRDCDLVEYCNGTSEWCPLFDDYMADGSECISGKAYCYRGHCQDRDSRCNTLFNGNGTNYMAAQPFVSGATLTDGTANGYCGYSYYFNVSASDPVGTLAYNYTGCNLGNQRCGTLYCVPTTPTGRDPTPAWKGAAASDMRFFEGTLNGTDTIAAFFMLDLSSSGYRDPGLAPNGVECGSSMMCVNSQCVPANVTGRCPNCNGNGVCAQSGQCYCNAGFKPPDCLQNGTGGSVLNHPPDVSRTAAVATTAVPVPVKPTNVFPIAAPRIGCSLVVVAACSVLTVIMANVL